MMSMIRKSAGYSASVISAAALSLMIGLEASSGASAGQAEAKELLKAMSNYVAAQKSISFEYDTNLEVITKDQQKILLASSGTISLSRPDKFRATRFGGFANVELIFNGKMLTLLGKEANFYAQAEVPGTVDHLISQLRDQFQRPLPGADLLMSNPYDELMIDVVDAKDLGSGVIGGTECDHLAFRAKDVDWQIWIAQGERPYPCRYVITSKLIDLGPQYSVQIRDWKADSEVAVDDFGFKNTTSATKIEMDKLTDIDELPSHFTIGGGQ